MEVNEFNKRPYQSDFLAFKLTKDENDTITHAEPFLAMIDGPYYDMDTIPMISLETGEFSYVPLEEADYSTNIASFYYSLVENSGISENRTSDILFGSRVINDFNDNIKANIQQACIDHVNSVIETLKYAEEYEASLVDEDYGIDVETEAPEGWYPEIEEKNAQMPDTLSEIGHERELPEVVDKSEDNSYEVSK